jgi:hypothetical protein
MTNALFRAGKEREKISFFALAVRALEALRKQDQAAYRDSQNLSGAIPCRFKSDLGHQFSFFVQQKI